MNKHFKNIICFSLIMTMFFSLSACGKQDYINVEEATNQGEYALQPVGNYDSKEIYEYADEGIKQQVEEISNKIHKIFWEGWIPKTGIIKVENI